MGVHNYRALYNTAYVLHLLCVNTRAIIMTNVTLSIEEEDLRRARIIALQEGTSLNAVIREYVKGYIGKNSHYQEITGRILQQAKNSQFNSDGRNWTRDELYER